MVQTQLLHGLALLLLEDHPELLDLADREAELTHESIHSRLRSDLVLSLEHPRELDECPELDRGGAILADVLHAGVARSGPGVLDLLHEGRLLLDGFRRPLKLAQHGQQLLGVDFPAPVDVEAVVNLPHVLDLLIGKPGLSACLRHLLHTAGVHGHHEVVEVQGLLMLLPAQNPRALVPEHRQRLFEARGRQASRRGVTAEHEDPVDPLEFPLAVQVHQFQELPKIQSVASVLVNH
mmetsp:Transcript_49659/g.144381  ORF Transcript_49659/g.144381 Transcript_49659/m.144381 type:complete len:236 (-) Transcript_49659:1326-2033(-)